MLKNNFVIIRFAVCILEINNTNSTVGGTPIVELALRLL